MELSSSQKKAVEHFRGPCLCMAGPGSGKTLVLTKRISHLIKAHGIAAGNILVVTFTRDAAMSMKQRFMKECSVHPAPAFGTFHSIFFNILRREGQISPEDIVSGRKALSVLSYAVNECGIKPSGDTFYPSLIRTVSYYKNCGIIDENIFPPDTTESDIRRIISFYTKTMRRHGLYDFDDLLVETQRYFASHPDRLDKWRDRFRFILVDEAQDMNRLQYQIITELARPSDNLFLVGDDDQAIYGFRGADPSFLMNFTNDYPSSSVVVLGCNYRSDRSIVICSSRLISENRCRFQKDLVPFSGDCGQVEVITSENERQEAVTVCNRIRQLIADGTDIRQIAVLYRNRRAASAIMSEMARAGRMKSEGDRFFYSSFVFSDLISILKCSDNPVRREDFFVGISHPDRNIGRMGLAEEMIDKEKWLSVQKKTIASQAAISFIRDTDFIRTLSPYSALNYIMKRMGYEKYIRDHAYTEGTDPTLFLDHAERFMEMAAGYHRISDFIDTMTEQKERALSQTRKNTDVAEVSFYTFHGSKGLEFDHVFIIGACDGITPSDKIKDEASFEEERRMFYVAMTRARRHLAICVCARYGNHSYYPSPFIKEAFG